MRGVGKCPLLAVGNAYGDGDAVDGHGEGRHDKDNGGARLAAAPDLIEHD